MAAVDVLPQSFDEKTLMRARRISEAYTSSTTSRRMKMPLCDNWKRHRRSSSQSSVYPITMGMLSPTQKRERRLKTRSFDCTRSLSVDIAADSFELLEQQIRQELLTVSSKQKNNVVDPQVEEDTYEIDPDIERMLQSRFDEMSNVTSEFTSLPQEQSAFGTEQRKRKHRRCQSILFRSNESEQMEKDLASDLSSAFNDFDFDARQQPVSESEDLFRLAVVNMIAANNNRATRRGSLDGSENSELCRSTSPLPTIHET